MIKPLLLLLLLLVAANAAIAADSYAPYLHKPAVPDHPAVRLFGQYNTLLFPGAATYNYPIEVPPGTHGLSPSLVIAYNSQSVQQRPGILGAGWSINQNYIYRDVNSTPNNRGDDKFLLVFQNDVYELLYNPTDGLWHTEVDYHFRIQNQSGAPNNDGTSWLLTTPDGKQYRFGFNNDSEITGSQNYALRWNQDQAMDTYGNTITYHYQKDPYLGDAGSDYLQSIAYNNDQLRQVTFTYEATPRPDQRTTIEQGNTVSETHRLSDITIYANNNLVRRYHCTYTTIGPSLSSLSQLTRYGADNTSVLHTITFTYAPAQPGFTKSTWTIPIAFTNASSADYGVRIVDVNNDGLADILQGRQSTGEEKVWLNNGTAWVLSNWVLPVYIVDANSKDTGVRFADVNNDGLTDILVAKAGTSQVYLNNGTGWVNASTTWTIPIDFVNSTGGDQGVQLADLDGDGRVDLLRATQGLPNVVALNNGTGWVNQSGTWMIPVSFLALKDTGARLVDINGDGLPDILLANSSNHNVWLNNGTGWTPSAAWTIPGDFTNAGYPDTGVRFVDIDGDGLVDLVDNIANASTSTNNTWVNNGTGWVLNNTWQIPEPLVWNATNVGRRLADVNGDGAADIIVSDNNNQYVWIKNPATPYVLSSITNEYGGTTSINYTFSTLFNNTGSDGISDIGFPILVVQRISKNNTINGSQNTVGVYNYSYANGKYNYTKREFRGFGTTTEQQPEAIITHYFYQDSPRRGKEYETDIASPNGTLLLRTTRDYNTTYQYGIYNISLRAVTNYQYDGKSTPRITNTTYVYDWFGNPLSITEQGDVSITGDERTTNYTYAYNKNAWILDHPARDTISDALGQLVKQTTRYYDTMGFTGIGTTGALTREEAWNNNGNNTLTTYTYDNYGNVLTATDAAGDVNQYEYDPTHTYPTTIINPLGHITDENYDPGTGNLLWTRKNDLVTSYAYDTHGRITREVQPYDSPDLPTKRYTYTMNGTAPSRVLVNLRTTAGNTMDTAYYYDGFGNLIQLDTSTNNAQIVKSLYYDGTGRLVAEDNPSLTSTTSTIVPPPVVPETNYTYDALDRVVLVSNPDGTNKTTIYDRANITDVDENGHQHTYQTDALGRITTVIEENVDPSLNNITDAYTTRYAYDANDNLVLITDTTGNQFLFTYDSLNRKTGMNDPDMGHWSYQYDNRGNLVQQTDARGQTITLSYDALNRLTSKKSTDVNETFNYDAQYQGTLTNVTMNGVALQYTYDNRLRPTMLTTIIDGIAFNDSYLYDSQDRVIADQGLSEVDYLYDKQGLVHSIPGYVTDAHYDAFGSISNRTLANGLTATYAYNTLNHRLVSITIPTVQALNYTYDNVGNIKSINDLMTGKRTFLSYDGLDRLTEALIGNDRYEYTYNPTGNIMDIVTNNQSKKFVYNALAHAPSSIIDAGAGADVYHPTVLGNTKNKTLEFFLLNDQNTTTSGVNASVTFGDGHQVSGGNMTNLSLNKSILFLLQNNYANGGNYQINITSAAPNSTDYQTTPIKFGVHATGLGILYGNVSERTFEFDVASDVLESLPNVSWNCTGINSTSTITLTGSLLAFLRANFTTPGQQTFSCTATGPDGNDTRTITFSVDGLGVKSLDTLATSVSQRVISFTATNNYYPLQTNISVVGENAAFSTLANLTTGASVMVFALVNNTAGDNKAISIQLSSGNYSASTTSTYSIKGVSIDDFQRVDLTNTTKALYFLVRNNWQAGIVSWSLTDPGIANTTTLSNNATLLILVASNYSQGDKSPTLTASTAGTTAKIADHFIIKPLSLSLLTLLDGSNGVSEVQVLNALGTAQNVTWSFNTGVQNFTNTTVVNSSLLLYVQGNYSSGALYRTTASANTASYNDTGAGVVIA